MLGLGSGLSVGKDHAFRDLNDITELELWFKNNTGVSVGQWDDSSKNANHATQGTGGNQGVVTGGGLDFEASNATHYDFSKISIAKNQGFAVAWVVHTESASSNVIFSDSSAETIGIQSSTKLRVRANNDSSVTTQLHSSDGAKFGNTKMQILLNRTGGGVWSVYKNGTVVAIDASSGNSSNVDAGENVMGFDIDTLGSKAGITDYFDGIIYEVAFWSKSLSSLEIADVNNYLTTVHGL